MAGDDQTERPRWVTAAAGVGAVAVLTGLTLSVLRFADEWSNPPPPPVPTTVGVPTTSQTSTEGRTLFVITPTTTSSAFPTSVSLSTTDIGIPAVPEATTTTPTDETTTATEETTEESAEEATTKRTTKTRTTTRKPRFNETRTNAPR